MWTYISHRVFERKILSVRNDCGYNVYFNGRETHILTSTAGFVNIESIEHFSKPKPLFQLPNEHGKMIDIFEGDKLFFVDTKSWYIRTNPATIEDKDRLGAKHQYSESFATEKAAQQYIDSHQKRFSKQELIDAIKEAELMEDNPFY